MRKTVQISTVLVLVFLLKEQQFCSVNASCVSNFDDIMSISTVKRYKRCIFDWSWYPNSAPEAAVVRNKSPKVAMKVIQSKKSLLPYLENLGISH